MMEKKHWEMHTQKMEPGDGMNNGRGLGGGTFHGNCHDNGHVLYVVWQTNGAYKSSGAGRCYFGMCRADGVGVG